MRKRSDWAGVVHIDSCRLPTEKGWQARERAWELARELELPTYNFLNHKGYQRYLVVRSTRLGETLVGITTKTREFADEVKKLAETLLAEGLADAVHWSLNETKTDISQGELLEVFGKDLIEEELGGIRLPVSAQSFLQANTDVAEEAYGRMRDWLKPVQPHLAWDLYCGVGSIAAQLSAVCEQVVGVENNEANVRLASWVQEKNGLQNFQIQQADVETWLAEQRAADVRPDVISVNPPRAGIKERGCHDLIASGAQRIAYMSCNPMSLIRDLQLLNEAYRIEHIALCDMFPQTRHFETVVLLERKAD